MITDETDIMQLQAEHKKKKHFPFFLALAFLFLPSICVGNAILAMFKVVNQLAKL